MRIIVVFFVLIILIPTSNARAIEYIQSTQNREIKTIAYNTFEKECKRIVYRPIAKKELPLKYKRILLRAMIRGESIASLDITLSRLRDNPGFCSYRSNSEKI